MHRFDVAPVLDKGFEDGAVHVAMHGRRCSVMPRINTERVRKLADSSRGGPPSSVLIRGGEMAARSEG